MEANLQTVGPGRGAASREPRAQALTERLRHYLELPVRELRTLRLADLPAEDAVAVQLILTGIAPNNGEAAQAARECICDLVDGKPKQPVEVYLA